MFVLSTAIENDLSIFLIYQITLIISFDSEFDTLYFLKAGVQSHCSFDNCEYHFFVTRLVIVQVTP